MSGFYDRAANTAKRLLTSYGKDITVTRQVNSGYDPSTGVAGSTSTFTVKGQSFDYSDYRVATSNGLIKTGDRKVLIAAKDLAFTPDATTDQLTVNGVVWSIVKVNKVVDEQVLFEIQVRRV